MRGKARLPLYAQIHMHARPCTSRNTYVIISTCFDMHTYVCLLANPRNQTDQAQADARTLLLNTVGTDFRIGATAFILLLPLTSTGSAMS